jgi:hypothetical protein
LIQPEFSGTFLSIRNGGSIRPPYVERSDSPAARPGIFVRFDPLHRLRLASISIQVMAVSITFH